MNHRSLSLFCCLAVVTVACTSPITSTPLKPEPAHGIPSRIEFTTTPGIGANGGRATIALRVVDAFAKPVQGVSVTLASSSGTIAPEAFLSDSEGRGSAVLSAPAGAVTVTASVNGQSVTGSTIVAVQAVAVVSEPMPNPPPPPPPGASGPLSVSLSATTVEIGYGTTLTAQIAGGVPASVSWNYGDGASFTGLSGTSGHTYGAAGTYQASVRVTDTAGRSAAASTTVTVTPEPPPSYVLEMHAMPNPAAIGASVSVSVDTATRHGAPPIDTLKWDCQGNGTIDATTDGNHTFTTCRYAMAGTFTARVTAVGGSVTGTTTIAIVVR